MLRCSPGANQSAGSISRDHLKSNRIALFVSRDLQPAVLNRAVHKQSLSHTVLITVWRLELSHVIDCPVMSQIRSYPEHVTFIFRHKVSIFKVFLKTTFFHDLRHPDHYKPKIFFRFLKSGPEGFPIMSVNVR